MNFSNLYELSAHSRNVGLCAVFISQQLGLDSTLSQDAYLVGIFHDLGKNYVDQTILNKPAKLNPSEYEHIKLHVDYSHAVAIENQLKPHIVEAIWEHHENFDGTGYPRGLKGDRISILGRIVRLSDFFVSLFENRVYRRAFSYQDVISIIQDNKAFFDPQVLNVFSELFCNLQWLEFVSSLTGDKEYRQNNQIDLSAIVNI